MNTYHQNLKVLSRRLQEISELETIEHPNIVTDMIVQFKKGGIHIKPENKGKFTATKKKTGKTTEELTHSKNPVTRKRAVFAQNAAKWNKKKK